jgi:hypothetical protein
MRKTSKAAVAFLLPALLVAQSTTLRLQVLEGEGAVYRPGSRVRNPVVVQICDEVGRPLAGAPVSFQLPQDGASGVFSNGLNTDLVLTGKDGNAAAPTVRWNRTPGAVFIRITTQQNGRRAGTLVTQQLSDERQSAAPARHDKPRSRWILIGILAAGAGVAGFATGRRGTATMAGAVESQPPAVQIGAPVIAIGRP